MAKFQQDKRVDVEVGGETVTFIFRQPTDPEWNKYQHDAYPMGRGNALKNQSFEARCALFDKLLRGTVNLTSGEDDHQASLEEARAEVPGHVKDKVIFRGFEDQAGVDVKN